MAVPSDMVLRYQKGSGEWQETKLQPTLTIGRSSECDLVIEGTGVSRQHARITVRGDGIWLTDLSSSNGTYIDNERLNPQSPYPLKPGSKFRISEFHFEIIEDITEPDVIPGQKSNGQTLLYRMGGEAWKEFPFHGAITIGRSLDCDLTVDDSKASRQHVRIEEKAGGVWLTDLGSSNGTRIDNQKLTPNQATRINPGQVFTLGNMFFSIQGGESKTEISETIYILWYRSDGPWKDLHITKDLVIGRSSECDLVIDDTKASRRHVSLSVKDGKLWLTDLGSRNGTRVAGQVIQANSPMMFMPGQVFQIGSMVFTITLPGVSQPSQSVVPETRVEPAMPVSGVPSFPPPSAARLPVYPPPPQRSSPWGWIVGIMGAAMVLACVCVAAISGLFIYINAPEDNREISASQTALSRTQVAMSNPEERPTKTPSPQEPVEIEGTQTPTQEEEISSSDTPENTVAPVPQGNSWLIMMYIDGDDQILERDLVFDANEVEKAGSTNNVQIVVQLDRYGGSYQGDGDWTSTRRYFLNQDGDLQAIHSDMLGDLGEVNMSSPNSLADFMVWAINAYPADKYVLVMSDHGSGWPGGYSDQDSSDDGMFMFEISQVLEYAVGQTGIGKLELMGFDACLMSQIEVLTMIEPYARYAVVSEEIEPSVGWAYTAFLTKLLNNPDMNGGDLAQAIVSTYIDQDQRLVDPEARREFLAERDITVDYSPEEIAEALWEESTLSAIDLSYIPSVNQALNDLAYAMQNIDQSIVASARTYAQGYTSIFGEDVPASYLDLLNFANLVANDTSDQQVQAAVNELKQAIGQAVLYERHGPARPGSTGITFYFPNSDLYGATYDNSYGYQYTAHVDHFAEISLWDEFMYYHYTGSSFNK